MNASNPDEAAMGFDEPTADTRDTRQPLVVGVTTVALLLATLVTILRVYVRGLLLRSWALDDYILVASYVSVLIVGLLMLINTHYGDGLHVGKLSQENYFKTQEARQDRPQQGKKLSNLMTDIDHCGCAIPLIKTTFLLQYRRVFPYPPFVKLCNMFLFFVVTFGITQVISTCLACIPLRSLWDLSVPGRCIELLDWWLIGSSINLFTDVAILCMPLPLLRTLRIFPKPLVVLVVTFGIGIFTCSISVIRITNLRLASTSNDPTYESVVSGMWSITELASALICVCVPTLNPLLGSKGARPRSYDARNTDDSADTELFTQSDGGIMSQKRHSRVSFLPARRHTEDPETPRAVVNFLRNNSDLRRDSATSSPSRKGSGNFSYPRRDSFRSDSAYSRTNSGVAPPPNARVNINREALRNEMKLTLPLTRVDTDDGVEFITIERHESSLDVPTPLKPPPRRHTDRSNRYSDVDYFSSVVWDSSGQPRAAPRRSMSPGDRAGHPP
ncbi:hypothetical protein CTRI78_v009623 [Colletotrichum trifolii]|uniref:Rhodopsin domain-containing protein n=1 Tax=Colletotrichum trifolii TaxID=5466 RepID=A0A4R8QXJ6_COLTR|nr:hypothetical protein CTRI78_v009623 [Colletotrichum trifolii]